MKLKHRSRSSLVDDVVVEIRGLIEARRLAAGIRLPSEPELMNQLGVSRTVLREAVSRLEALGLVSVERGRGTFVGDRRSLANCMNLVRTAMAISPLELETVLEFRRAIECHAVRCAAETATPDELAELATLCDAIDDAGIDSLEAMRRDFRFHVRIVEFTRNELIRNVMDVIEGYALAGMLQTTPVPRDRERSHGVHRAIVEAIRARDPDAAEVAMRQHMDYSAMILKQLAEYDCHASGAEAT